MERMRLASISTVWRLMTRMPAPKCSRIFRDSVTSEIWGIFSIRQDPVHQQSGGNDGNGGVFGAADLYFTKQGMTTPVQYTLSKSIPSLQKALSFVAAPVISMKQCARPCRFIPAKDLRNRRNFPDGEAHTPKLYHIPAQNANPSCEPDGFRVKIRQNSKAADG